MEEKDTKALERIKEEINKISNKENNIFFFILDSKGNASGSLEYVYKIAYTLKNNGYNVSMLHQEEEFVGVSSWLGEQYASLPHYNISKDEINVGVSDILFIPEIFSTVMNQTKKLPCKRVVIMQNMSFLTEYMPLSVQLGDFGISDCITNSENEKQIIKKFFPYINTLVVNPYIDDEMYKNDIKLKNIVVNVVCKDQSYINQIVKPFYWRYPLMKWLSFKDLRGLSKEEFAENLRRNAITIWVDDNTNFGYTPLEAMKSGSIVIGKFPEIDSPWFDAKDEETNNSIIWFNNVMQLHDILANVVKAWIEDSIPSSIGEAQQKLVSKYTKERFVENTIDAIKSLSNERIKEMENIIEKIGE